MLEITIPGREFWDEKKEMFITSKETTLKLEHSLVSLSKWESKWHKPYFGKEKKTPEETLDYIRMMTLTQNVDPEVYHCMTPDIIDKIAKYIEDPMTATWFNEAGGPTNKKSEVVTAELIYYWMIAYQIPFECQKWHINKLITLIRVCNIKNQPDKKMSKREVAKQQAAINAARRKAHHSKG